jgi:CubicO group peptidase (beta-lactamase class C family)
MAEGSASILTEASRPDGRVRLRGITSDRAAGRVTDGDQRVPGTAGDLAGMLRDVARRHRVPGAQLAVHQHGDTVTAEFGELEHGAGRAVSPETAFPVGSISKVFTATLAMILVADGDLELDVPLHECLPELGDLGREITLRHVLSHTSGLASGPASEDVSRVSLRRYVVGQCHRRNLVLPPGTGFSYSNVGYAVAGLVIEAVTGMSWYQALESIVLRPLGVDPVTIGPDAPRSARRSLASGHSVNPELGRIRAVRQSLAPGEAPAGALAVSALDLVALARCHIGTGLPQLLPPAQAALMRRAVPGAEPFGLADGWGLGLAVFRASGTDWVGHDGNADGTSCHLRIDPVGGRVIALTTNANVGAWLWQELATELGAPALSAGAASIPACSDQSSASRPSCEGVYVNGDDEYVITAGQDGDRYLIVDGDPPARLSFVDGATFSLRDPASNQQVPGGRLVRNATTGEIDGLQIGGRFAYRSLAVQANVA